MHPLEEKDSSPLEDTEITRLINVSKELGYKKQDKIPERNLVDFKPTSIMQIAKSSNQQDQTEHTSESNQYTEMKQPENESEIKESLNVSGRHVSMDAPLTTNEDGGTLMDVMANNDAPKTDQTLMAESLQKEIERSLSTLTDKEREIIRLFFGIGMNHGLTLEEIGAKFNLTRERVRQIKEKAIRRLRHTSRNKLLKSYLG